jgi:imidazoleglycerol-phosphate dehydratase
MSKASKSIRYGEVERETRETKISLVLDLDGGSRRDIATGIGFLDHMLELFAFHGEIDLGVKAEGDLGVDDHHTVEDIGICLGQALHQAIAGDKSFCRYGSVHLPMDEALVLVALDISGRGMLTFNATFTRERMGGMSTENIREFFRAVAMHSGITIHIHKIAGENDHHVCEAMFKGFARALCCAIEPVSSNGPRSTKGSID